MVLKRIGLTGASGMVGRHLRALCERRGIDYVATSRTSILGIPAQCHWYPWNLATWKSAQELDQLFGTVDVIFHVGARVPRRSEEMSVGDIFDANVRACLNIGQWACQRNIPLVFLSGATVYADPARVGILEDDQKTDGGGVGGFYGYSKWIAEEVLSHFRHLGLPLLVLRASSVYGSGLSDDKMISSFLKRASRGEVIELQQPIGDTVDLIHASDVAEAIVQTIEQETWGTFNIASERQYTMEEIAQACVDVVGRGVVKIIGKPVGGSERMRFGLSCNAARAAFDFQTRMSLIDGLTEMWNDMRTQSSLVPKI